MKYITKDRLAQIRQIQLLELKVRGITNGEGQASTYVFNSSDFEELVALAEKGLKGYHFTTKELWTWFGCFFCMGILTGEYLVLTLWKG